jgi:hypothetical protein
MAVKYNKRKVFMISQAVVSIFSYSFVFLLGVILGAVGELIWSGRFGKSSTPVDAVPPQRIEIPQINVDLSGADQPQASPAGYINDAPIQVVAPVLTAAQPAQPAKPSKEDAKKPQKVLSIVEQVDEILKELQKFSKSGETNINLLDDGKQGVIVRIGNQTFPGIDAVTDPESQALIRQAVSEWERRTARK